MHQSFIIRLSNRKTPKVFFCRFSSVFGAKKMEKVSDYLPPFACVLLLEGRSLSLSAPSTLIFTTLAIFNYSCSYLGVHFLSLQKLATPSFPHMSSNDDICSSLKERQDALIGKDLLVLLAFHSSF